jgi:toxin-antitoxin system PIN domain toxin
MTYALDVNVLVYAADADSRYHAAARKALARIEESDELVYVFWPVIFGYLRIATNPRIFSNALDAEAAIEGVDDLLALPQVRAEGERKGFLRELRGALTGVSVRGPLFSDAHIVALMRQYGVSTIYSHDRDFRKFDGIKVVDPFA